MKTVTITETEYAILKASNDEARRIAGERDELRKAMQTIALGLDRALDSDKTQTCRWMLEVPLTDEEHAIVKKALFASA